MYIMCLNQVLHALCRGALANERSQASHPRLVGLAETLGRVVCCMVVHVLRGCLPSSFVFFSIEMTYGVL